MAQHLATTYGDRAFKVAKLAKETGKRWPIVGKKLHDDFPYIEAEVSKDLLVHGFSAIFLPGQELVP